MSKSTKIIAALGVVAGLGVAALPAFSYATENVTGDVQVQVEVLPAIAMTISGNNDGGTHSATSFKAVTPEGSEVPSEEGWYELSDHTYSLSEDSSVDPEKTYYEAATPTYSAVDNFNPDTLVAGRTLDGHTIPATAVAGTSSSYISLLPNSVIEGDTSLKWNAGTPTNNFGSEITVYTNAHSGYTLKLKDADANTDLTRQDGAAYIPASGTAVAAGTAGWNYDVTLADGTASIEHAAITASDATIDSLDTATSGGNKTYVDYNVATAHDQATGVYTDTIVYTAVTNN